MIIETLQESRIILVSIYFDKGINNKGLNFQLYLYCYKKGIRSDAQTVDNHPLFGGGCLFSV